MKKILLIITFSILGLGINLSFADTNGYTNIHLVQLAEPEPLASISASHLSWCPKECIFVAGRCHCPRQSDI